MSKSKHTSHASWWIDIVLLVIILGSLFIFLAGVRPLFVPDEGRYAEIAREMVVRSDYVTPYLNDIKYFEKPILFYWLGAAAIKLGGLNLWSLRSINALLGLFGCLMTYGLARRLYDRLTGFLAGLILGTCALYTVMTQMISLDLPVTVFISACLYSFLLGQQTSPGWPRRLCFWFAAAFAALAVLTKGLIGIVLPGLIIAVWFTLFQQWRHFKSYYFPTSLGIFFLIVIPWHYLVGTRNPEFFYFYFIEQHFLRYTTMDVGHYQPVWFFIPVLLISLFPWVVFTPQAVFAAIQHIRQRHSHYQVTSFLLLWALLVFGFFSFSKSKLIPYILPVLPPLAIITADYLRHAILAAKQTGLKVGYVLLALLALGIAYGLIQFIHNTSVPDPLTATRLIYLAAAMLVLGSLVSLFTVYQDAPKAIAITITTSWLFMLTVFAAFPAIDTRTIQPLALRVVTQLKPQDEVITFNQYYQDLPFYLERRVTIVNWKNELSFGMQHQATQNWMIDTPTFWQRWHSKRRVFVLLSDSEYHELLKQYPNKPLHVLGKTLTNFLISNQP